MREHRLDNMFCSPRNGQVEARCTCGWASSRYTTAGMAGTVLEAHLQHMDARRSRVEAALIVLENHATKGRAARTREAVQRTRHLIAAGMDSPVTAYVQMLAPSSIVVAEEDTLTRSRLVEGLTDDGHFDLFGARSNGPEAVALTILEAPRFLVLGSLPHGLTRTESLQLLQDVRSPTLTCVYGDDPDAAELAHVTVGAEQPIAMLQNSLLALVA